MDYGIIVPQGWRLDLMDITDPVEAYEAMSRVAQEAEALGFRSLWLYDHFHTVPTPLQEITFECWTSTAALARDTKRIRLCQTVTCNSYRNPALLAKMVSTVDVISHGRLELGIGAGWYEHEYRAYGYSYPNTGERLQHLHEAVQIILAMWTQDEAVFEGTYYQVRGAINRPKGVQKPHIPLLIGGGGEKVTLKLVAQYANACNIGGNIATIKHKLAVLKNHCDQLGRDYNGIRRTTLIDYCAIAETEEGAIAKLTQAERDDLDQLMPTTLIGTPETIRKRLREYEDAGIQEIIVRFVDAVHLESIRLFAQECMQTRENDDDAKPNCHSSNNLARFCQIKALGQIQCACLLSQLHLSLFTDSAQRTKIHWCLVRQNRDVCNHFRKHAARPRAGPFLAVGAAAFLSCFVSRVSRFHASEKGSHSQKGASCRSTGDNTALVRRY